MYIYSNNNDNNYFSRSNSKLVPHTRVIWRNSERSQSVKVIYAACSIDYIYTCHFFSLYPLPPSLSLVLHSIWYRSPEKKKNYVTYVIVAHSRDKQKERKKKKTKQSRIACKVSRDVARTREISILARRAKRGRPGGEKSYYGPRENATRFRGRSGLYACLRVFSLLLL